MYVKAVSILTIYLPNDVLDIVLYYTGDDRLLELCKNKKKLLYYSRVVNARMNIEKYVIRYKCPSEEEYRGWLCYYINNNNDYFLIADGTITHLHLRKYHSYTGTITHAFDFLQGTKIPVNARMNILDMFRTVRNNINIQILDKAI